MRHFLMYTYKFTIKEYFSIFFFNKSWERVIIQAAINPETKSQLIVMIV